MESPESERFVVKNTHEALVTQEQWDIVQEVRQRKKRVPKHMDEPNIFSGLVFCADRGKPLVLHRASTMKKAEYNFKHYTYIDARAAPFLTRFSKKLKKFLSGFR